MSMYVRKVLCKEYNHHPTTTTYNNTSTALFRGSSASNWTVTYAATTGGYMTATSSGSTQYLSQYDAFTLEDQMIFEVGGQGAVISGTSESGIGMLFMADDRADAFTNAYRLRQTDTTIYIEKTANGGTSWSTIGSDTLAASVDTNYHYRIYYTKTSLNFYGLSFEFDAGKFQVYRGLTQDTVNNTSVLTCTDASPLTAGGYIGYYAGELSVAVFQYMGAYKLWSLTTTRVKYAHEIDEPSFAEVYYERHPDQIITEWAVANRVEIWNYERDLSTGVLYVRLVFDGLVAKVPFGRKVGKIEIIGMQGELTDLPWNEASTQTGTLEATLQNILPTDGGQFNVDNGTTTTYALHRQNISLTSQNTEREIAGANADVDVRRILSEDGAYMFYHPDGRFFIRNDLMTDSLEIDGSDENTLIGNIDYQNDGNQIVNQVEGYHDGWASPNSVTDATSLSAFGGKGVSLVDMHSQTSTVAGNVGSAITGEYDTDPRIAIVYMIQQGFNIFPGYRVDCILPGTDIGTNATGGVPDSTVGNWSAEACTCNKVVYDSSMNLDGNHLIFLTKNDQAAPDNHLRRRVASPGDLDRLLRGLGSMDV